MNNMTVKQRNFYIFCGVLVVGWFVVRFMTNAAQQAAFFRQQAIRARSYAHRRRPPPVLQRLPRPRPVRQRRASLLLSC